MRSASFFAALLVGGSTLLFAQIAALAADAGKTGQAFGNYSGMVALPGAKGSLEAPSLASATEAARTTFGGTLPAKPAVKPEWVSLDLNGNGVVDAIALDENGDGMYDSVLFDEDEDGILESGIYDIDYNGIVDVQLTMVPESDGTTTRVYGFDEDEDGRVERYGYDYKSDGTIDEWKQA